MYTYIARWPSSPESKSHIFKSCVFPLVFHSFLSERCFSDQPCCFPSSHFLRIVMSQSLSPELTLAWNSPSTHPKPSAAPNAPLLLPQRLLPPRKDSSCFPLFTIPTLEGLQPAALSLLSTSYILHWDTNTATEGKAHSHTPPIMSHRQKAGSSQMAWFWTVQL